MFYNILDTNRKKILPPLIPLKQHYYLVGGTGLALQIGHRKSEDFDDLLKKTLLGNLEERTVSTLILIQFVLSKIIKAYDRF